MKKTKIQSYASEYCMLGGDNAVSRKQINDSMVSPETTNEHQFVKALQQNQEK